MVLPPNVGEIEFLRQLPNLERISFRSSRSGTGWTPTQTAAEFWAEWEGKKRSEVRDQMSEVSKQPPSSRFQEHLDSGVPGRSEISEEEQAEAGGVGLSVFGDGEGEEEYLQDGKDERPVFGIGEP
jgi:hypothetical protein